MGLITFIKIYLKRGDYASVADEFNYTRSNVSRLVKYGCKNHAVLAALIRIAKQNQAKAIKSLEEQIEAHKSNKIENFEV